MATDPKRIEEVFAAALSRPDQTCYLDQACAGDPDLRRQVEELLAAHAAAGSFLEPSPVGAVSTVPAEVAISEDADTDTTDTSAVEAARDSTAPHAAQPNTTDSNAMPLHHAAGESGALLAGKYRLVEEIGEGGMGTVWMAQQTEPVKRLVAVKLIKAGMDSRGVLARFEAERQALALMDHPNIAKVLDAGETPDGRPFFVMELVKGVPITKFCDARKLTPSERLELFIPVCQAIQHAHQKGIIHRDIKPTNVLIAIYDDKPVPKVIDFGVAKATGQQLTDLTLLTGLGAVVGTPQYMSPEQASLNNLDIDTRSDVYSLGVLLYELLTGSTPFSRKELAQGGLLEMLRAIREQEPQRPSTRLSSAATLCALAADRGTDPRKLTALLRGELDWVVMKALEKDRSRRYETATGLAADVQRYLAGEQVQAVPPSTAYRLRTLLRRNRGLALASAVVLLSLIVGVVGTSLGLVEANHQRDNAEDRRKDADRSRESEFQQRQIADDAKAAAIESAKLARQREGEARKLAFFSATQEGLRLADTDDLSGALSWFVRAMETDPENADAQTMSRIRFATYERYASVFRLTHVFKLDEPSSSSYAELRFNTNGTQLFTRSYNGVQMAFRQWNLASDRPSAIQFPKSDLSPHPLYVRGVFSGHMSRDASRLLSVSRENGFLVRDLNADKVILDIKPDEAKKRGFFVTDKGELRTDLCLLPDGKKLLRIDPTTLQVWDIEGDQPSSPVVPITRAKTGVKLSVLPLIPSEDGRRIAVACAGSKTDFAIVRLLDAATLAPVCPDLDPNEAHLESVALSPDGKRAATLQNNGTLRVWDTDTGLVIWTTTVKPLSQVGFGPDGQVMFARSGGARGDSEQIQFLDISQKRVIAETGPLRSEGPIRIEYLWSPDGRYLAVGPNNGVGYIVDTLTGKLISQPIKHGAGTRAVVFSPDGRRLATTGADGLVRIWEFRAAPPDLQLVDSRMELSRQPTLLFGPSPETICMYSTASSRWTTDFTMWDVKAGGPIRAGMTSPTDSVRGDVLFQRFVVDTLQGPQVWDPRTNRLLRPQPRQPAAAAGAAIVQVRLVDFTASGPWLLVETADGFLHLCDGVTGLPTAVPPVNCGKTVRDARLRMQVAVSPDEKQIVICDRDNAIHAFGIADGHMIGPPFQCDQPVNQILFLVNGRVCVVSQTAPMKTDPKKPTVPDSDSRVDIYDVATGARTSPQIIQAGGRGVVVLPGNTQVMIYQGSRPGDEAATVWDLKTGQRVGGPFPRLRLASRLTQLPGGKLLAGQGDGRLGQKASIFDPATQTVTAMPSIRDTNLIGGRVSADGRRLLAGRRLWDTANWQPLTPPVLASDGAYSADPELRQLLGPPGVSLTGFVRYWDLSPTQRSIEELRTLAHVWSGQRFTKEGLFVEDTVEEQWQHAEAARARFPAAFASATAAEARGWHLAQAADALQSEPFRASTTRPSVTEFHLSVLARTDPASTAERYQLATLYADLARSYRNQKQPDLALARYRTAIDHLRGSLRIDPNDSPAAFLLVAIQKELANYHAASNRSEDAIGGWCETRDGLVRLVAEFPVNYASIQTLAWIRTTLGVHFRQHKRPKEAEVELIAAVDLYRRLVARQDLVLSQRVVTPLPGSPPLPVPFAENADNFAWSLSQLGIHYRDSNRPTEAEKVFAEAVALRRTIYNQYKAVAPGSYLAWTLTHAARAARLRNDLPAARRFLDEALALTSVAIQSTPSSAEFRDTNLFYWYESAFVGLAAGDHSRIPACAAAVVKVGTDAMGSAYDAGCFLARCVPLARKDGSLPEAKQVELADRYAEQAVQHLRLAIEKGYKDAKWMREDTDLDSIRDRADFKSLLVDLEKIPTNRPQAPPPRPVKLTHSSVRTR